MSMKKCYPLRGNLNQIYYGSMYIHLKKRQLYRFPNHIILILKECHHVAKKITVHITESIIISIHYVLTIGSEETVERIFSIILQTILIASHA